MVKASNLLNPVTKQLLNELLAKEKLNANEQKRLEECKKLIARELKRVRNGEPKNCGLNGCLFEILSSSEKSTKKAVAKQGKADNYYYIDEKRKKAECKTNGGRLGNLYKKDGTPKAGFIVVGYCYKSRSKKKDPTTGEIVPNEKWYIAPTTLWRVSDFLEMVERYNFTKIIGHTDKNDYEIALKGDSKKLYKVLCEYPITFEPEYHYFSEDFEGLEF